MLINIGNHELENAIQILENQSIVLSARRNRITHGSE